MKRLFLFWFVVFVSANGFAQQSAISNDQIRILAELSKTLKIKNLLAQKKASALSKSKGWRPLSHSAVGTTVVLKGVDTLGFPLYLKTLDNTVSAATTQTNAVQPGGVLQLNLSGASSFLNGKLAIWDEGIVDASHVEFAGKSIFIGDGATNIVDHTTHTAGTMVAKGVNPRVKGMAFGATTLQSFDFNNDEAEMAAAASGLIISNHSYGYEAGWNYNNDEQRWEWDGLPGDAVDYKFGFYSNDAKAYDDIAFYAPQYLIVQAAGNSHSETGPPIGSIYYGFKSKTDATLVNKGPRPQGIDYNDGYDVISGTAVAKNILTVGAVYPLPNGPSTLISILAAPFSSWGPTDDGRIKPDICGNGVNVLSSGGASSTSYFIASGTSTASPNVSGSLFLLQEYYAQKNNGNFMRSATLKGLACHTAFDAGNIGPDYIYGWGLLDMNKAAQVITNNGGQSFIAEQTLTQDMAQSFTITANGLDPLKATISWTDPSGTPPPYGTINSRKPELVNDLDIRITDNTGIYLPWVLDPANPTANAITGDNIRDNIEQIVIDKPIAGKTYNVSISNKGKLIYGLQNYSLIVTGVKTIVSNTPTVSNLSLNVYPVPAASIINVSLNSPIPNSLSLSLFNSTGVRVYNLKKQILGGSFVTNLNVSNLPSGVYVLLVKLGNQTITRTVSKI